MGDEYANSTKAGACFDRASYPTCFRKSFTSGEGFTSLSFNGPTRCGSANDPPWNYMGKVRRPEPPRRLPRPGPPC